jgi:hypothetical protein
MSTMQGAIFVLMVTTVLLATACSKGEPIPVAFVGTWQSDETLTLASMSESELVTPEDRERFSDNFFGDRVIVFEPRKGKTFWVGEDWMGVEQEPQWFQYDIVSSGSEFMTLRYPATEYSEAGETTWRVDGDLIYAELRKWGFREYYRRIDN